MSINPRPKPKYWIPANAEIRNPKHWYNPESLCRSCAYIHLQEPYCDTVDKNGGVSSCSGYILETKNAPSGRKDENLPMGQLQLCPFCNGSVSYQFFEPKGLGDYEPEHNFICDGCEILIVLVDVSKQEAIEIYNNRPKRVKDE